VHAGNWINGKHLIALTFFSLWLYLDARNGRVSSTMPETRRKLRADMETLTKK